jgi:hypothetical protein
MMGHGPILSTHISLVDCRRTIPGVLFRPEIMARGRVGVPRLRAARFVAMAVSVDGVESNRQGYGRVSVLARMMPLAELTCRKARPQRRVDPLIAESARNRPRTGARSCSCTSTAHRRRNSP